MYMVNELSCLNTNILGMKKKKFVLLVHHIPRCRSPDIFSCESRLDRAFISQCVRRRRYDERRQVWKNSFLSRRVQVAHVGIKRINIHRVIVRIICRACRHVYARARNVRYSLREIKFAANVP